MKNDTAVDIFAQLNSMKEKLKENVCKQNALLEESVKVKEIEAMF